MESIFKEIAIKQVPYFVVCDTYYGFKEHMVTVDNVKNSKTIYETELELPLMDKGENFYIEHQDKFVIILDVIRSDSAYIYIVDRIIEEDDIAMKQYNEDKNKFLEIKDLEKENVQQKIEIRQLKWEIDKFKESKYYQRYLKSKHI